MFSDLGSSSMTYCSTYCDKRYSFCSTFILNHDLIRSAPGSRVKGMIYTAMEAWRGDLVPAALSCLAATYCHFQLPTKHLCSINHQRLNQDDILAQYFFRIMPPSLWLFVPLVGLRPENIYCIIDYQAFPPWYDLAPSPSPPTPVSKFSCVSPVQLTWRKRGEWRRKELNHTTARKTCFPDLY